MNQSSKSEILYPAIAGALSGIVVAIITPLIVPRLFPPPTEQIWSVKTEGGNAWFILKVDRDGNVDGISEWSRGSGGKVNKIYGSIKGNSVDLDRLLSNVPSESQNLTGDISFNENTGLKIIKGKWTGYPLPSPNESRDWTAVILKE